MVQQKFLFSFWFIRSNGEGGGGGEDITDKITNQTKLKCRFEPLLGAGVKDAYATWTVRLTLMVQQIWEVIVWVSHNVVSQQIRIRNRLIIEQIIRAIISSFKL